MNLDPRRPLRPFGRLGARTAAGETTILREDVVAGVAEALLAVVDQPSGARLAEFQERGRRVLGRC